ncbi:hypothetical protein AAG570_004922 [Ranatra chinensis]|uniref:Uncharacterized protein n=1 Tax=Ranatra chinensis TaxID=642074 RepID=A0ABD0YBQ2_9HEMI
MVPLLNSRTMVGGGHLGHSTFLATPPYPLEPRILPVAEVETLYKLLARSATPCPWRDSTAGGSDSADGRGAASERISGGQEPLHVPARSAAVPPDLQRWGRTHVTPHRPRERL